MAYFVTGATGVLGRTLVRELLDHRDGEIFLLAPLDAQAGLEALLAAWDPRHRVTVVPGDLAEAALGVDPAWVREHDGGIEHFFHLAALEVGSTRNALELAADLDAGCFHLLSSVAASGDYGGFWDETMFDVDQDLPTDFHRSAFDSERVVREESAVPWRVYRTGLVIGDSGTGEVDAPGGPYYVFPLLRSLRDLLPPWTPLVALDLGDTNVVPVDYVAKAMDHLAHLPDRDEEAFHLVNPEPQRTIDVVNIFAAAAGAPRFTAPVDRSLTTLVPTSVLPASLRPGALLRGALRSAPGRLALRETVGRVGMPPEAVEHLALPAEYGSRLTEQALAGSGISVPVLESYAARIWGFWEEQLAAPSTGGPAPAALSGRTVVVTGAATPAGRATASRVARAGGTVVLVDRDADRIEEARAAIVARGGTASVSACDSSDPGAVDALADRLGAELEQVDFLVTCTAPLQHADGSGTGAFSEVEDALGTHYLGTVRLTLALQALMRAQPGGGHVVHVGSGESESGDPDSGGTADPSRGATHAAAQAAARAAWERWSAAMAAWTVGDRVSSTYLPPARHATPTAAQVADRVVRTLAELAGASAPWSAEQSPEQSPE